MTILYLFFIFVLQIHINSAQQFPLSDPIQQFRQIQREITSNIFAINNHYAVLTRNLQESIQNLINHSSITTSIERLETNLNSFGQSQCSKLSETALSSLSTSSREDISVCANLAVSALTNNITIEAQKLITKLGIVQGDITERLANCFKNNLANQVGMALCLVSQISPVQVGVASLTEEIQKTYAMSEAVAQNIIFELSNCILNVENVVDNIASNIVSDFRSCIV